MVIYLLLEEENEMSFFAVFFFFLLCCMISYLFEPKPKPRIKRERNLKQCHAFVPMKINKKKTELILGLSGLHGQLELQILSKSSTNIECIDCGTF